MFPSICLFVVFYYEFIMCQGLGKGSWEKQELRSILWTVKAPQEGHNQSQSKLLMDKNFNQKSTCWFLSIMKHSRKWRLSEDWEKTTGAQKASPWQRRMTAKWWIGENRKRFQEEPEISIPATSSLSNLLTMSYSDCMVISWHWKSHMVL